MADRRLSGGLLALVLLTSCGGDGGPTRAELVDALKDGGLEPVEARCWVGEVYDHLSLEDKRAIERADISYDDFENPAAVKAANRKC